jgi:hypothetical protein
VYLRPRLPLSLAILVSAVTSGLLAPSRADAVCSVSACDAPTLISNPSCCTTSTCTIDGTLTVSAPACTFDFGTRNLIVSGQVAAQGKTITLKAKSMKLTGLIDVRGPSGANAGSVTIVTTGMTALAYSQDGGTSAIIDASSSAGAGGQITIQADGMVSLAKGSITANGGPAASGGTITVSTTAGDVNVQIAVSASSGATATVPNGSIAVLTPGSFVLGASGRLVADLGTIDVDAANGGASFADGSVVQANGGGGSITLLAGSVTAFGEFRAAGEDGSVDLRAISGPMLLSRPSQGITVGPGVQSVSLATEASGAAGLLTMDMPILANGAEVDLDSEGSLVVSKKIETTGILDSGAGDISIGAVDDVQVTKAIVGADVYSDADLSIDARDITVEGNLDFRGGLDTSGGQVSLSAARDLVLQGDIFVNVSGADSSDGGSIDLQAGRNVTVGSSVELIADGSQIGAGGSILVLAGEGFGEHLPGDVSFLGDVKANGHITNPAVAAGSSLVIQGCNVSIPSGAVLDVSGDVRSVNMITGRTSLTIGGQLRATQANVLEFPAGGALSLTGSFIPARSAGACVNGTITANGCQRSVCTGPSTPAGCLYACPTCGDNVTQFPETCETGASGNAFCDGLDLCDVRCRVRTCTTANPCANPVCDAVNGVCGTQPKADGTGCDADANVCTGVGTCSNGICRLTPGSALQCNDQNPCTGNPATGQDTCDPVTGCNNTPLDGPRAGCNDGLFCNGNELCVSGQCQSGSLPCPPPQMCNPQTEQCEGPAPCQSAAQCNDGNPCTDDVCQGGFCSNPASSAGTNCDDSNVCNGVRTCNGSGICQQATPLTCADNNPCTTDGCDPILGCMFVAVPGCCTSAAQCNDGDACTADSCQPDNICAHDAVTCDDGNACTTDACNPQSGCTATPIDGCQVCADASTCSDDADPCTDKACVAGACAQVPNPNCCQNDADCTDIDSNPCTQNGPCTANRCAGPFPITGPAPGCGTTCNPAVCAAGVCTPETPPSCTDNNPCTTDFCSNGEGCVHTPIAGCCFSDGECNDDNVCTADTCDLDRNGCDNVQTDETCVPCVGGDPFECGPRCSTGCQGGRCAEVLPPCETDDNPCTTCDPTAGCQALDASDVAGCDDGQACNGEERCVAGVCQTQPSPECDDNDTCTADSCDDTAGCVHTPKTSYDAVACRLDAMIAMVDGAAADAVKAKFRKQVRKKLGVAETKLGKARTASCRKAKTLLGGIRGTMKALQKSLNRGAGRQIDATLATDLARLAGEAGANADQVRAGLGC